MAHVLVVGAGISGCVAARMLAEKGYEILVVDRRNHIGGNAYDAKNAVGITIQMHGPHVFHAKDNKVWNFLGRFTGWRYYQHRVMTYVRGRHLPFPVNLDTINQLYNYNLDCDEINGFFAVRRQQIEKLKNLRDAVCSRIGEELYDLLYRNYTRKLWGVEGEELPASLAGRQSCRDDRDDRYFTDPYQGVPENGYTAMFTAMLDHPAIEVRLNCPYRDLPDDHKRLPTIYTGPIDEYFGHRFGKLPYRSLRFLYKTYDYQQHQPVGVVHFPNDYDFVRATEYKHITGEVSPQTTVVYEYPRDDGEPYNPMPTLEARELYQKYADAAEALSGLHFIGPFGRYRNMNMNYAALEAMDLVDKEFPSNAECSVILVNRPC